MKYSLLSFSAFALLALSGCNKPPLATSTHSSKTIVVEFHDPPGYGGGSTMPAIDGFSWKGSGMGGNIGPATYKINESYLVQENSPGHFVVQLHDVIDFDGVTTVVDKTLPVYDTEPPLDKWTKLDSHFQVDACFGVPLSLPNVRPVAPPPPK